MNRTESVSTKTLQNSFSNPKDDPSPRTKRKPTPFQIELNTTLDTQGKGLSKPILDSISKEAVKTLTQRHSQAEQTKIVPLAQEYLRSDLDPTIVSCTKSPIVQKNDPAQEAQHISRKMLTNCNFILQGFEKSYPLLPETQTSLEEVDINHLKWKDLFFFAIRAGQLTLLKYLCQEESKKNPKYIHERDEEGRTALIVAAQHSTPQSNTITEYLLEQHARMSDTLQGKTPLMWAAYKGNQLCIEVLIKQDGPTILHHELNIQEHKMKNAIHYALDGGHRNIADLLIEKLRSHNIEVDAQGDLSIIKYFSSNDFPGVGNTIEAKDSWLTYAVRHGNTTITRYLTQNDSNFFERPFYKDAQGLTALMHAAIHFPADANFDDTPLSILLNNEAPINEKAQGKTAILWAADKGNLAAVQEFIRYNPATIFPLSDPLRLICQKATKMKRTIIAYLPQKDPSPIKNEELSNLKKCILNQALDKSLKLGPVLPMFMPVFYIESNEVDYAFNLLLNSIKEYVKSNLKKQHNGPNKSDTTNYPFIAIHQACMKSICTQNTQLYSNIFNKYYTPIFTSTINNITNYLAQKSLKTSIQAESEVLSTDFTQITKNLRAQLIFCSSIKEGGISFVDRILTNLTDKSFNESISKFYDETNAENTFDQLNKVAINLAFLGAAENGNDTIVKHFIEKKYFVETTLSKDKVIETFIEAIKNNHLNTVKLFITNNLVDINEKDNQNCTALHYAVSHRKESIVSFLIQYNADINQGSTPRNITPLIMAVKNQDITIFNLLLRQDNLKLSTRDTDGHDALMYAIQFQNQEMVQCMLTKADFSGSKSSQNQTALLMAILNSVDTTIPHMLIEQSKQTQRHKEILDLQDSDGIFPLLIACMRGNVDLIQKLIREGASIDIKGPQEHTALTATANSKIPNNLAIIKILVGKGADINHKTIEGYSALMYASYRNELNIVQYLIEQKATIDLTNNLGYTALIIAIQNRHTEIAEYLIQQGAIINPESPMLLDSKNLFPITQWKFQRGNTPLMFAIATNNIPLIQLLIRNNASIEQANQSGHTPLMLAIQLNENDIISILLEKQNNLKKNSDQESPLFLAARNGNKNIVIKLLEKGADINAQDAWGQTPLIAAITHCNASKEKAKKEAFDLIKFLVEKGANIKPELNTSTTGRKGVEPPMILATREENTELVEYLIEKEALLNSCDAQGRTPFMIACEKKSKEIVEMLIQRHTANDIKSFDSHGNNFFFYATDSGDLEILEKVIQRCPLYNFETTDSKGNTILLIAASKGFKSIVDFLLKNNYCRIDRKNNEKDTALTLAAANGFTSIVEKILEQKKENKNSKNAFFKKAKKLIKFFKNIYNFFIKMIGTPTFSEKISALFSAIKNGSEDIVKILLKENIDLRATLYTNKETVGETPLTMAIKHGQSNIFKLLLSSEYNADINQPNSQGLTPLMMALEMDATDLLYYIIELPTFDGGAHAQFRKVTQSDKKPQFGVEKTLAIEKKSKHIKNFILNDLLRGMTSFVKIVLHPGHRYLLK